MTFLRAQWGRVESATATPCQSRQGPIVSTKIRSFKEEEAHCPAPHPALAYKGQKGAQQNAHPDPYAPCLAWGWQTHSIHEAGAKTTGTMGSAPPVLGWDRKRIVLSRKEPTENQEPTQNGH